MRVLALLFVTLAAVAWPTAARAQVAPPAPTRAPPAPVQAPPAPRRRRCRRWRLRRFRRRFVTSRSPNRPGFRRPTPVPYLTAVMLCFESRVEARSSKLTPDPVSHAGQGQSSLAERVDQVRRKRAAGRPCGLSSGCGRRTSSTTSRSRCTTCNTPTACWARCSSTTWKSASASRSSTTSGLKRSTPPRLRKPSRTSRFRFGSIPSSIPD